MRRSECDKKVRSFDAELPASMPFLRCCYPTGPRPSGGTTSRASSVEADTRSPAPARSSAPSCAQLTAPPATCAVCPSPAGCVPDEAAAVPPASAVLTRFGIVEIDLTQHLQHITTFIGEVLRHFHELPASVRGIQSSGYCALSRERIYLE